MTVYEKRQLTEKQIKKFRQRAIAAAKAKGYDWCAEDFAQDFCMQLIEKGWRQTVDQALIDFQRKMFGRTRQCSDSDRKSRQHLQVPGNATKNSEIDRRVIDQPDGRIGSATRSGYLAEVSDFLKGFESEDRAIFVLNALWELNLEEIGYCFGITESRVSQRLTSLQERISEKMAVMSAKRKAPQVFSRSSKETSQRSEGAGKRQENLEDILQNKRQSLEFETSIRLAEEKSEEVETADVPCFEEWLT